MAAVLVHIDLDGDLPHPASLAALAAGRLVASSWGAALYAAVIVHDGTEQRPADSTARVVLTQVPQVVAARARLAAGGADKVLIALTDAPVVPLWSALGGAWQAVLDHLRPRLVLFGADAPAAAELGARTGARIGARLLLRARPVGGDIVELRDRDGSYARATDGGAAVVLVGSAPALPAIPAPHGHDPVETIVLAVPGGADPRIELAGSAPAQISQLCGTLVALGDDVASDAKVIAAAKQLAAGLGGVVVGGKDAAVAGAVSAGGVLERGAAIAPELCVQIGALPLDLAGSSIVLRIGTPPSSKAHDGGSSPTAGSGAEWRRGSIDGSIDGKPGEALAELVEKLELRL